MDAKKRKLEEEDGAANGSGEDLAAEDANKLLEPLSKEELIGIVRGALLLHKEVLGLVRKAADKDPLRRKLFVRGLGWDTETETLRAAFSPYGEIADAVVVKDKVSGKSKGYGFITFRHADSAVRALKQPSKKVDGRMAAATLAAAASSGQAQPHPDQARRKIFVGGVPPDLPAETLLEAFSRHGEIEEGPLGFDKQTGKSRGFVFFIYKNEESAACALEDPVKTVDGHPLNCRLADTNAKQKPHSTSSFNNSNNSPPPHHSLTTPSAPHHLGFNPYSNLTPPRNPHSSLQSSFDYPLPSSSFARPDPSSMRAPPPYEIGGMPPSQLGGGFRGHGSGVSDSYMGWGGDSAALHPYQQPRPMDVHTLGPHRSSYHSGSGPQGRNLPSFAKY